LADVVGETADEAPEFPEAENKLGILPANSKEQRHPARKQTVGRMAFLSFFRAAIETEHKGAGSFSEIL
jgi:hypothetical protein